MNTVMRETPCGPLSQGEYWQRCWRNPDTGYMEHCPVHEEMIADMYRQEDAESPTEGGESK